MRKILIIGVGGIGSFLTQFLDKVGLYEIHLADPDIVETKNLTYQNYNDWNVGERKVSVMDKRYESVKSVSKYKILTDSQIVGYDLVVSCVDNLALRRMLYDSNIEWLDLRAQGRNSALISYMAPKEMYSSVLSGPEGSFSCQGENWDGGNTSVHFMQVAVAGLGSQWIQRWFEDKSKVKDYMVVNL